VPRVRAALSSVSVLRHMTAAAPHTPLVSNVEYRISYIVPSYIRVFITPTVYDMRACGNVDQGDCCICKDCFHEEERVQDLHGTRDCWFAEGR
jgi:hypothetical protein